MASKGIRLEGGSVRAGEGGSGGRNGVEEKGKEGTQQAVAITVYKLDLCMHVLPDLLTSQHAGCCVEVIGSAGK